MRPGQRPTSDREAPAAPEEEDHARALGAAPTVRSDDALATVTAAGPTPRAPFAALAAPAAPPGAPLLRPGSTFLHYEIMGRLGAGGMGMVFLARDTRLDRLVAIKLLLTYTGAAAHRFLAEARMTAQCRHDNIVVIYDVGELDGYPYMVLEYIEGQRLRDVMTSGGVATAAEAIELILPVARALQFAHEMGIVHRDLKPENILLSRAGQVKVLDFGVAKQVSEALTERPGMTQDGALVGTMPYMSPEQLLGQPVDARTDLWAVGIILFELLTGEHPLAPLSLSKLTEITKLSEPMPSARERRPDALELADIVDRCLKKRKEERLSSARDLVAALDRASAESASPSRPEAAISPRARRLDAAFTRPSADGGARSPKYTESTLDAPGRADERPSEPARPPRRTARRALVVALLWILSVGIALYLIKTFVPAHGRLQFGFEITPSGPSSNPEPSAAPLATAAPRSTSAPAPSP